VMQATVIWVDNGKGSVIVAITTIMVDTERDQAVAVKNRMSEA